MSMNNIATVFTVTLLYTASAQVYAKETSSYHDIPVFGGPSSIGAELKEENAPVLTGDLIKDAMPDWFATKDKIMKEHGLAYGINYSTAYQSANNSTGENNAWGGLFQLPASWTLMQDKDKGSSGAIVFKVENHH